MSGTMWCHLFLLSPAIGLGLFFILPWTLALPLYLVVLALSLALYRKIMQSMHQPVMTGREKLLGRVVEVGPDGSLKMDGERWSIVKRDEQVSPGEPVRIVGFMGLRLKVQPVDDDG